MNTKLQEEKGGTNNLLKQTKMLKEIPLYLDNFMPNHHPNYASSSVLHKHIYTFFPKALSIAK